VSGHVHRWTSKALSAALIALWTATLACAATAVTPAARCQRNHAPCCPRTDGQSCANAECARQAPSKSESRATQNQRECSAPIAVAALDVAHRLSPEPARELTEGVRFRAAVFRLKDDLRI
jgi:hypothetical protein